MAREAATPERHDGLTAAVIRYYRISILLVLGLLSYGIWVFVTMPRTEDPEFDVGESRIVTRFPGASTEKVESLFMITKLITLFETYGSPEEAVGAFKRG